MHSSWRGLGFIRVGVLLLSSESAWRGDFRFGGVRGSAGRGAYSEASSAGGRALHRRAPRRGGLQHRNAALEQDQVNGQAAGRCHTPLGRPDPPRRCRRQTPTRRRGDDRRGRTLRGSQARSGRRLPPSAPPRAAATRKPPPRGRGPGPGRPGFEARSRSAEELGRTQGDSASVAHKRVPRLRPVAAQERHPCPNPVGGWGRGGVGRH